MQTLCHPSEKSGLENGGGPHWSGPVNASAEALASCLRRLGQWSHQLGANLLQPFDAHLLDGGVAVLDVIRDQCCALYAVASLEGREDCRMLVIGLRQTVAVGEIEPSQDA